MNETTYLSHHSCLLKTNTFLLKAKIMFQSAGSTKVKDTKKGKKNAPKTKPATAVFKLREGPKAPPPARAASVASEAAGGGDSGAEDEVEVEGATADVDMLLSLTGQPVVEDELLFAIPVVAPYNTLGNYK